MLLDIEQICGIRLGPGTLYGAIARLEKQGWIEAMPMEDRRRPYRLTAAGRAAFTAKMSTLRRFVAAGEKRLGFA
jgi:DNA-binding PadR family transcriptional regulator